MIKNFITFFTVSILFSFLNILNAQKLTKEERRQQKSDTDSLFIIKTLPITISLGQNLQNADIKDSIEFILKLNGYKLPDEQGIKKIITTNALSHLPNPALEQDRFSEEMQKVARDNNYYFELLEKADPFLQAVKISFENGDSNISIIKVMRHNFPNVRKLKEFVFPLDEKETIGSLALRIVNTLINKKQDE
jgi:hypothetical protein